MKEECKAYGVLPLRTFFIPIELQEGATATIVAVAFLAKSRVVGTGEVVTYHHHLKGLNGAKRRLDIPLTQLYIQLKFVGI